jgi:two-component system phosphate regulon response regulator OmpR
MSNVIEILAVDDDPRINRVLSRLLLEEGFTVRTESNVPAALSAMKTSHFSLLILDVMMPGETGFDLAKRLRSGELGAHYATIPIVFLTAEKDEAAYETSFDVGAHAYLTKPFAIEDLMSTIHSVMG